MATILVLFGFCWMVVAAIIGVLLAKRHESSVGQLEQIAATGNLLEYHRVSESYKWNKTVHAHSFLFSVVAVCVGLAMAKMNYPENVGNVLASVLMLAPVVWTTGGLRSNRALMVIGDLALLIGIVMAAVGLVKAL